MTGLPDAFRRIPIAHRALHDVANGRPENSRAAIAAALDAGYGIEIDLQLSADGTAMVFHDYDLQRLTGQPGTVQQCDAAVLAQTPLTGGAEGIPTLAEVLKLVNGRVPMLIELKDQHGQMGITDGRLERAVAADLAGYGGPVGLMSFNPNAVALLAEELPQVPRGIVSDAYLAHDWALLQPPVRDRLRDIPDYERVGASFISQGKSDLMRPRVAALKKAGATVLCWTIRSPIEEADARQIADNITFEGYRAEFPT